MEPLTPDFVRNLYDQLGFQIGEAIRRREHSGLDCAALQALAEAHVAFDHADFRWLRVARKWHRLLNLATLHPGSVDFNAVLLDIDFALWRWGSPGWYRDLDELFKVMEWDLDAKLPTRPMPRVPS
ncbi:MAG: hypothetical protein AB7O21_02795 [Gammaproteobacteria bacterium]